MKLSFKVQLNTLYIHKYFAEVVIIVILSIPRIPCLEV